MNRPAATAAVVAVIVVALLVYFLYPSTTVPPGDDLTPGVTDVDRGDSAREAIAGLQESGSVDYDEAFDQAQAFQADGRFADAQLMLFFAARGGHARSAFQLGTAYDPNHHDPASSLLPNPDPFQAYRWYTQALDGGVDGAAARLEALHDWVEREAQAGNAEAEQLLLQWN
jgi:TPR repeat protein